VFAELDDVREKTSGGPQVRMQEAKLRLRSAGLQLLMYRLFEVIVG
jgi:hypothetical protein